MANLSQSECRRLYSWWWDSHNTPKNSKWLQDNIADMDGRVKSMIKLIELDADSFARRAEMYYKKRPELMKLVEEFYRAYRALAERYDHATGELRHAHKTIAAAFPDLAPFELIEDSPSHSLGRDLEFGTLDIEDPMLLSETKILALKKALADMEAEKEGILLRYHQCLEKLTKMEGELSNAQMDSIRLNEKASRAEIEVETLKEALIQLEIEKENECLGKITELENIVSSKVDEASMLKKQLERTESEASKLKKAVADMNKEKEASSLQYKHCLETIGKLEKSLSTARDEVERLNNIVLIGTSKLKSNEEKCRALAMSNQALQVEADNLVKKIAVKDEELSNKEEELEKLQSCLQDKNTCHAHAEAALETLQNLHTQSQDDQRALAMELRNVLRLLEDVEAGTHGLEEELQHVRDENLSLSETPFSLSEIRERLEKKVTHLMSINISLQHEISCLKEEIEGLNKRYHALFEQVESAGLNPTCLGISIKSLKDENSRLKQMHEEESSEKEILLKKLEDIEEVLNKKVVAESSLSGLMYDEKLKALQESFQLFNGKKAILVAEKASLLSQRQATTENTNNLLRQNAVLENSLSAARVELEGLREKSKGLHEICNMLKNERSFLLNERDTLVYKLESVERKLRSLDKKHLQLREKYAELEKENETMHFQVEKLEASLGEAKRERIGSEILSGTKMAGLKNEIHLLQEEKKKSEQELENALKAQFEISILQKFIKDMESKNHSLIVECQKHVGASNLAEKVILELESESLEQQVEAELLLDEIGRLRLGIYRIFTALESPDSAHESEIGKDPSSVDRILESIEGLRSAISKHEDEKQLLFIENSVFEALLEQLQSKGVEIELQKVDIEEAKIMANKLSILNNENKELLEINTQLKLDSRKGYETAAMLEDDYRSLCVKQSDLQTACNALKEAHSQAKEENAYLLEKFSDLTEEKRRLDQHNDDTLLELLAKTNQSAFLQNFAMEKAMEVKSLLEDLNRQHEVNDCLRRETNELGCKLDLQKAEKLVLKDTVCRLEREMYEMKECNVQMKKEMANSTESLIQTQAKLFDTEMHLEAMEKMNATLYRTVAELRIDVQSSELIREDLEKNINKLSEANSMQMEEIQSLHKVNKNLDSELGLLHQELEENAVREQTLSIALQGMSNEAEVWEAEAATFCFDLQASSVQEVLLKDKVKELTLVCKSLEVKNAAKTSEFEQMKGQICDMENEITRLKSRVSAYAPVIASLTDDLTLLELKAANSHGTEFLEFAVLPNEATPLEDQTILRLQNLQKRVQLVGKMMEETNKSVLRTRSNRLSKQERSNKKAYANTSKLQDSPRLQRTKTKSFKVRNTMLMKDIPLDQASNGSMQNRGDQMLELWEIQDENKYQTTGESLIRPNGLNGRRGSKNHDHFDLPSTDSDTEKELAVDKLELSSRTTELNDENILNRLASDADKLESLKNTLHNLRRKVDTNKKGKKGKSKDFETVKEQVQEAEDSLVHLLHLNVQLVKNLQDCPHDEVASPRMKETVNVWRGKVMEEAEKGSEKVDMLLLGVQRILFFVSKMEDEGRKKGSEKFLRSRTVILRDFIHSGRKNSLRKKKGPNCGCFAQQNSSGSLSIS